MQNKTQQAKKSWKQGVDKLRKAWNENPQAVIAIGATAVYATAKLIDAVSAAEGRHAYKKQVNASIKRQKARAKKSA